MLTLPAPAHRRPRPDADDWQRTDGGVYVPRVPLRGGMMRRGMGFGFEPAGCCCVTGGCGPYSSMKYDYTGQVVLVSGTGILNNGKDCAWMNGDFELPFSVAGPALNGCTTQWRLMIPDFGYVNASFYIDELDHWRRVSVYFSGPLMWVNLLFTESTEERYENINGATWTASELYSNFNCDASGASATVTIAA